MEIIENAKQRLVDVKDQLTEMTLVAQNTQTSLGSVKSAVEGTLWMLENRFELVSSPLYPVDLYEDYPFPSNSKEVHVTHAESPAQTGKEVHVIHAESPAQTPRPLQVKQEESISPPSKVPQQRQSAELGEQWPVPSWYLRTRQTSRRYSGDAAEHHVHFNRRCSSVRRRLRRRKSVDPGTLDLAAAHAHQLEMLRDNASHHSNTPPGMTNPQSLYRRSRSCFSEIDVSFSMDTPIHPSTKFVRQCSLSSISSAEVWPESITALLTGGQLLLDRSLLFSLLADSLGRNGLSQSRFSSIPPKPRKATGLRLLGAGISIPHPDKPWGGEDAFFVSDDANGFVGVADGVGEWGQLGCNPRQFAEELMEGARQEVPRLSDDTGVNQKAGNRARRILSAGYTSARSFGSSTALVAGLDANGEYLGIANIGDSTCLILRRESKRHRYFLAFRRTREQQHFFNCPYQLSKVPNSEDIPALVSRGMDGLVRALTNPGSQMDGDTPDMADVYDIKVLEGDLLVIATDGVFDNLFDQEIASLVSLAVSPHEGQSLSQIDESFVPHPNSFIPPKLDQKFGMATPPEKIAQAVAEAAFYRSMDPRARSPFARQARKSGGFFVGGKMDDITCVAVWVV